MKRTWSALALALALALVAASGPLRAGDRAGAFDYWVLALSWNASWCEAEGDARAAPQCHPRESFDFTLHGLWPQYETGWPESCASPSPDPSRRETSAMADIMGSSGLAFHQWKKHGRCSGLSARDYFALARAAFARVTRPPALAALGRDVRIAPEVIEAAFIDANPAFDPDGVTVTCRDGRLAEVRLCLTRDDLSPRPCAPDAARDCPADAVDLPAAR